MKNKSAIAALAALAQDSRLQVFRLLVQAGPQGLAPMQIAEKLDIAPSSLSFHLKEMTHAQLTVSARNGRSIVYSANFATMIALILFLSDYCCGGNPCSALCSPAWSIEGASS